MKKKLTLWAAICMAFVCIMSMTAAAAGTATIAQCIISGTDQITVVASVSGVTSDDGNLYLFELKPYQSSITGRTDYCAVAANASTVTFVTTLDQGTSNSKLYSKFVVAALQGGTYKQVSQEYYITNLETIATHTAVNPVTTSIKGVTVDNAAALALSDLGVQHASMSLQSTDFSKQGQHYLMYIMEKPTILIRQL
jgi:hypothetical protein